MLEFFNWAVQQGLIQSDPNALATGKHADGNPVTEAEYREVFGALLSHVQNARQPGSGYAPTFAKELMDRAQGAGILLETDDINYLANQATAEDYAGFVDAVLPRVMQQAEAGGAPQVPTGPHPAEPGAPPAPAVGTPTGVLAGGYTVRNRQDDGTYRWYQVYEFPPGSAQYVAYQFDNVQQVEAAFGGVPVFHDWNTGYMNEVKAYGAAEEVVGMAGNWNTYSAQVMRESAQKAGVTDPTLIGKMWSDPEMQQIATKAITGDWTPEQILAEQRKTNFWKNVLYPGIESFYARTTNPEKAWLDYSANIEPTLEALGYQRDASGTFNTQIKEMLDLKISDEAFNSMAPTFVQAKQNVAFAEVLNQRTQVELGKSVGFGEFFDLLAGEALPDIQRVAEGAAVAYQAQQAGVGVDETMLQRLIAERDLSEAEARNLFSEVNQAVLALGEPGLQRGGLTRDEVLSAAAGINPETGRTIDEVRLRVAKIAQENDLFDESKVNFYLGFSPSGTPTRPGLAALRPEGA
jgi:hypothetical protein